MEQGRRGRAQEDDASNAEIDGDISVLSSGGHEHRIKSGDTESESGKHLDNSDNADGRDDAFDVDRRADNGARRREWNIADNICRDSGGVAEEFSDDISIRASGDDKLFQRSIIRADSVINDSVRNLCGSGVAADTDNVCEAGSWSASIWRAQ